MVQTAMTASEPGFDLLSFRDRIDRLCVDRCLAAAQDMAEAGGRAAESWVAAVGSHPAHDLWRDATAYWCDFGQRSLLFWDTLRQRGNNWLAHEAAGKPPLLDFEWDLIADGRSFERPVNYALVEIVPPAGVTADPAKRPYLVIDPRAGHGPGIGGFKQDSQVGLALRAGHSVYAVIFFPDPVPGQTLADVALAESRFVKIVGERHPGRGKPVVIGNCQGGWAAMLVGALDPDLVGPIVVNGAPMSYWAGNDAENPMRYAGGILGGSWPALLASDLGGGTFDGAYLVENFEYLNPSNTYFGKYYNLFSKIDTEPARFLEFERWWGGFFLMNRDEIKWIVDNLFVGNRLAAGKAEWSEDETFDLRRIRSPIILFASLGDNITPPQQAFNWVADLYPTTEDLKANGQVIVGLMHASIGHLGIFVSASVARREHAQIVELIDYIEHLPPGLYQMRIDEIPGSAPPRHEVTLTTRRVEDLQRLQKYDRRDELPFRSVAEVSEWNATLYETFVHPVLGAAVSPEAAKLTRAFQPLRMQRWAISDINPLVAPLKGLAEGARAWRVARDERGPSVATEKWLAEWVTASGDTYRKLRDAMVENLFFGVYGTLSLFRRPAEQPAAASHSGRREAAVREAMTALERGGVAEAGVRVALLAARLGHPERKLSHLKLLRQLAGRELGLLDLPVAEARRIIWQQAMIVDNAPEEALRTLPKLVPDAEDRARLLAMIGKLTRDTDINPQQRALLPEFERVLAPQPRRPGRQSGAA
jgi:pimeloyl-ACP methyl ester carboxylesterase